MVRFAFIAVKAFMMVLAMAAFAFAAQGVAPDVAGQVTVAVGDAPWWKGILNGFLGGLVAVFYGYAKNRDPKTGEMEGFDIKYAFPTMIVGGIVGVIATLMKATPQDFATSLATSPIYGAVVFSAEAVCKAVFRHSVPWIRDAIDKLKAAPKENPTVSPEDRQPTR